MGFKLFNNKISKPWLFLIYGTIAMLIMYSIMVVFLPRWFARYRDFERHTVDRKPTVLIRLQDFLQGRTIDARLIEGWNNKKQITTWLPEDRLLPSNTLSRIYDVKNYRIKVYDGHVPMYHVTWSHDTNRVAISFHGYFVAAYERSSGARIGLKDYYIGGALSSSYDYIKCNAAIESFLEKGPPLEHK